MSCKKLDHEVTKDGQEDSNTGNLNVAEESEEERLDRLGRERPERLGSVWRETGFVFSIAMSQLLTEYFISGFSVIIPTLTRELNIPPAATTWPTSVFSLVLSSFLLPFGRLADIYGGYPVYLAGCSWTCLWSLIAGFSKSEIMLNVCRALQGLGPAAYLPAGLTLLGSMYRPGPRKNLVFSIYGSMSPIGFFSGIFFAGISGEYSSWPTYFFIGAALNFIVALVTFFAVPSDQAERKGNGVKMDWFGSATIVIGLILLVFAITQASHAEDGWATHYILVTLIAGIISLAIAFYLEGWVVGQPLLPFDVFLIPSMRPFIIGLLFAYGTFGIYLLYATLYITNIMGVGSMLIVAWYVPMVVGGCMLAILGAMVLHRLPGTVMMIVTGLAIIVDSLLFALSPPNAGYWAWVFPAMICATLACDLIFSVANIFLSTVLPTRRQGLAGALANVIPNLGIAILLGFADVVAIETRWQGEKQSYKNVFWFELACGAAALTLFVGFVRIDRAKSDLTADEKEANRRRGEEMV